VFCAYVEILNPKVPNVIHTDMMEKKGKGKGQLYRHLTGSLEKSVLPPVSTSHS